MAAHLGKAFSGSPCLLNQLGALSQGFVLLLQAPLQLLAALLSSFCCHPRSCRLGHCALVLCLHAISRTWCGDNQCSSSQISTCLLLEVSQHPCSSQQTVFNHALLLRPTVHLRSFCNLACSYHLAAAFSCSACLLDQTPLRCGRDVLSCTG